jgi:hypothetical protein
MLTRVQIEKNMFGSVCSYQKINKLYNSDLPLVHLPFNLCYSLKAHLDYDENCAKLVGFKEQK